MQTIAEVIELDDVDVGFRVVVALDPELNEW